LPAIKASGFPAKRFDWYRAGIIATTSILVFCIFLNLSIVLSVILNILSNKFDYIHKKLRRNNLNPISVTCFPSVEHLMEKAKKLAESLDLPFQEYGTYNQGIILIYTDTHLELRQSLIPGKALSGPLFVDFVNGSSGYRHLHNCTIHQPLARAVGIKQGFRPLIVDGTAGLGRDGFVLACLGCSVTMIERSQILGALLEDGLQRALHDERVGKIIRDRIHLIIADTNSILTSLSIRPYTIYLDPMYPNRSTSALNKKEMRIIRTIVGDDNDSLSLLECALQIAENRVVVKRSKGAPPLGEKPPSHHILMKNSRFDVYLTNLVSPSFSSLSPC
jgi:16S rRNA (guanine1516-N2)-methyltransferase